MITMPKIELKPAIFYGVCQKHGTYEAASVIPNIFGKIMKVAPADCPKCKSTQGCKHANYAIKFGVGLTPFSYRHCLDCGENYNDSRDEHDLRKCNSNVPPIYFGCNYENMKIVSHGDKQRKNIIDKYVDVIGQGAGDIVFYGGTGAGKTYTACAILNTVTGKGMRTKYVTFFELMALFREYDTSFELKITDLVEIFSNYDLLVLDEVGTRKLNEREFEFINYFIDVRHSCSKSTIFITNLIPTVFEEFLGDRIISRVKANNCGNIKSVNFGNIDKRG